METGKIIVFQFPSNGKVYPKFTGIITLIAGICMVSIPFKREGVSKVIKEEEKRVATLLVSIPFKREGVSKVIRHIDDRWIRHVSIPFKREGVSKVRDHSDHSNSSKHQRFQFPSNGKVYPK